MRAKKKKKKEQEKKNTREEYCVITLNNEGKKINGKGKGKKKDHGENVKE